MKKLLSLLTGICLAAALASGTAEGAALEEKALELAGSSLRFPAVTGLEDGTLQDAVNARIREDLGVEGYVQRLNAVISDDARSIAVDWDGEILGDVFSGLLEAESTVSSLRSSHAWTASNVDLRDGHEITLSELFTDEAEARGALESLLEETVAPELSPHIENRALTPLPETFRLERTGLTLLYGAEQLGTLSGRAGAVKIGWNEIRAYTDWSEDGIPARIGADGMVNLTEESAARLEETTAGGQLPDIPLKIGDSVKEWTDRTRLLNDPEEYSEGRMFALEGAPFRDVYLLSDALGSGWDESRVQGIRMDRGCVWGLCIGETAAQEWHMLLGEPDYTADLDEDAAEYARNVPGTSDYYVFGDYRLILHADMDGILASITLAE